MMKLEILYVCSWWVCRHSNSDFANSQCIVLESYKSNSSVCQWVYTHIHVKSQIIMTSILMFVLWWYQTGIALIHTVPHTKAASVIIQSVNIAIYLI